MTAVDLTTIKKRAEHARAARSDIARCEMMRVTPAPYSHRKVAESQADIDALVARVETAEQERDEALELVAEATTRWEDLNRRIGILALDFGDQRARIAKVRELHQPFCDQGCKDATCPMTACSCGWDEYPCPTVEALGGEQ